MACLSLGEPERWRGATQDDANVSQEGLRSAAILTQVSCPKDNGIYPKPWPGFEGNRYGATVRDKSEACIGLTAYMDVLWAEDIAVGERVIV